MADTIPRQAVLDGSAATAGAALLQQPDLTELMPAQFPTDPKTKALH